MSRLTSLSPEAIRAVFSTNSDDTFISLITLYDPVTSLPTLRVADNFTKRLSETSEDILYGVTSRSDDFIFMPMSITLPSEEDNSAPRCSIVLNDVTRYITPLIRNLGAPPKILLELVLKSTPDIVEAYFSDFYITGITYNESAVTFSLDMIDYSREPFPCYYFTPAIFPGLF